MSQCTDINYSKKRGKKIIDIAKKDTDCEFKSSDFPSTTCSLIDQQRKSYGGAAAKNADSVEKSEFLEHMRSTEEKPLQNGTLKLLRDWYK